MQAKVNGPAFATLRRGRQSSVVNGYRWRAFACRCFPKTIEIPASIWDQPVEACQPSFRLADVLRRSGVRVLGDLHGCEVGDFAWETNCGFETLHELDSLGRWASGERAASAELHRNGDVSAKRDKRRKNVRSQRRTFIVPESVCELRLDELPITQRLGRVCRSIGVRMLGDLNGRSISEFLECRDCGWRTLAEIDQLIEFAISGEFDVARVHESEATAELLILLEQGIAKLSPRERQYLLGRIHGLTFAEVGQRQTCTRARAHQVVGKAVENLRKIWGPRIPRLLEMLKRRCSSIPNGSPLTSALLEQWIADSSGNNTFHLSTKAHLRLIAALDTSIPCYVERASEGSGPDKLDLDRISLARLLHLAEVPEGPRGSAAWPSEHLLRRMLTHW